MADIIYGFLEGVEYSDKDYITEGYTVKMLAPEIRIDRSVWRDGHLRKKRPRFLKIKLLLRKKHQLCGKVSLG